MFPGNRKKERSKKGGFVPRSAKIIFVAILADLWNVSLLVTEKEMMPAMATVYSPTQNATEYAAVRSACGAAGMYARWEDWDGIFTVRRMIFMSLGILFWIP